MAIVQREVRRRGIFGWIIKIVFILFNLAMVVWFVALWYSASRMPAGDGPTGQAANLFAGLFVTGASMAFWLLGELILGILVLLSRGQRILITEDRKI